MVGRPRTALACLAAAGLLLLGACSSSSADSGGSTTFAATSSAASSPGSSIPVSSTSPSPSSEPSPSEPSSPMTSSSQPWPTDFTPEQAAAAQAAIDAYKNASRVTDEAYADPGRADLEAFIRQYIADPRANQIMRAAQKLVADRNHTTGYTISEASATAIEGNRVTLAV